MPCDSISVVNVDLSGAKLSPDLLHAALADLGQSPYRYTNNQGQETVCFNTGIYNIATRQMDLRVPRWDKNPLTEARIKQAYSRQVVKSMTRFGWQVRETKPGVFEALKR